MSLIHWWPLNGDTHDRISGITLTNNNSDIVTSGKIGKCYQFNGTNNLNTAFTSTLPQEPTEFSFALWIKLNSTWGGWGQIFTIGKAGADWRDIRIGLDIGDNKTTYFTISDGSNSTNYSSPQYSSLTVNKWYHIAGTFKNKTMRLFIDGQLQASKTASFFPLLPDDPIIAIGGNGGENGECDINDVRIYDHALSLAEIQELKKALVLHYTFTQPLGYNDLIKDNSNAWETAFASSSAGTEEAGTATYDQIDNSVYCTNNNQNIRFQYKTLIPAVTGEMFEVVVKYKHINGDKTFCFQIEEMNSADLVIQLPPWWSHAGSSPNVTKEKLQEYHLDDGWILMKYSFTVTNPETAQLRIWLQSGPDYVNVNNSFYLKDFQLYKLENIITDESGLGHNATLNSPEYYRFVHDSVCNRTALHSLGGNGANVFINTTLNPSFISNGTVCLWYQKDAAAMDNDNDGNFLIMTPDRTQESGYLGATSIGSAPTNNDNCSWRHWYYDGIQQNQSNEQDTEWHFYCATGIDISQWRTLQIHSHPDDKWVYQGKIADFRIYNSVLSPEEVKDLYNCGGRISNLGDALTGSFIEGETATKVNKNHTITTKELYEQILPDGYQQLEYIQSTGSQYINTGISLGTNMVFDTLVSDVSEGAYIITQGNYGLRYNWSTFVNFVSGRRFRGTITGVAGAVYRVQGSNDFISINGINGNQESDNDNPSGNVMICNRGNCKMHRCTLYNSNVLVRDFIPTRRTNDNALGLYDIKNNIFYTNVNSGSSDFIAGPTITTGQASILHNGGLTAREIIEI